MLKLLQSIFGGVTEGNYPKSLVTAAIERAVDGTDPCLRAISGYKKKLRPAVLRSIDHVVSLVDRLPVPIVLCPAQTAPNETRGQSVKSQGVELHTGK